MSIPVFVNDKRKKAPPAPLAPGETRGVLPDFRGPPIGPGDGKAPVFKKPAKGGRTRRGGDPFASIWKKLVGAPRPKPALTIRKPNGGRSKKTSRR